MTIISDNPSVQAFYEQMVSKGESPRFAEMLALRSPPGVSTTALTGSDDGFGTSDFENFCRKEAKAKAAAAGVSTAGKRYMPQVANELFDPQAWVSDVAEAGAIVKRRRWTCQGKVNIKQQYADAAPKEKYEISEKLLNQKVKQACAENPHIAPTPKEKRELKEKLRKKHSGQ